MDAQIHEIAAWISQMVSGNPYSSVGVSISVHDGRICYVEKTLTTKEKVRPEA